MKYEIIASANSQLCLGRRNCREEKKKKKGIETRRQKGSSIMTTAPCLHEKKGRGSDRGK